MKKVSSFEVKIVAIFSAILAVSFWGASFTATKVAVREVSPLVLLWLRFGIGVLVLGVNLMIRGQFRTLSFKELLELALLGFIGVFLHNYIQSTGLQTAAAGVSALIVTSTPVVIALLGALFLSEKLTGRQILGIFVAAFGVLIIVSEGRFIFLFKQGIQKGELFVTFSVITWATFSVLSRKRLKRYMPSLAMFYVMLSGLFFITLAVFANASFREIQNLSIEGWGSVFFLGIFCSALAYLLWYSSLKVLPASQAGIFMYLSPLVGVTVATILLSEPLRITLVSGGFLILTGMTLVNYSLFKKK